MTFPFRARGCGRRKHTAGQMNGMERLWALKFEDRQRAGEILWFAFEAVTFKLAPDTRYTPDFTLMLADGTIEFWEVKGFMEDDAWVKIKVAASLFPFRFVLVQRKTAKQGGGWEVTNVGESDTSASPTGPAPPLGSSEPSHPKARSPKPQAPIQMKLNDAAAGT